MSMGDLSSDLIGTDPKYPKIVNQNWLDVNTAVYDNYPSDNNPVRIQPKLSEMWRHDENTGANLIPNTTVQQLGLRTAEEQEQNIMEMTQEIVREAKKAIMSGKQREQIADHIRGRFSPEQIKLASEALKSLSKEVGLMGNVYVDASAFKTYDEAEKFFVNHRNRLARDILFDPADTNPAIVSKLASEFRKNVVSEVKYDDKIFSHYKDYLVMAGRIPRDFVIDSKESLRAAFLYEEPEKEIPVMKKASDDEQKAMVAAAEIELQRQSEKKALEKQQEAEVLLWNKVRPIVVFAQQNLSKGKDTNDLKEMIRAKFASSDVQEAAGFLKLIAAGLKSDLIEGMVADNKISEIIGDDLKKIASKYPIVEPDFPDPERSQAPAGIQAHFHSMNTPAHIEDGKSFYRRASVTALKKGFSPEAVRDKLMTKMSEVEAEEVITDAINMMNSTAVGSIANAPEKPEKEALFEELPPKKVLPTESETVAHTKEFVDFFAGRDGSIDVDIAPSREKNIQIDMEAIASIGDL